VATVFERSARDGDGRVTKGGGHGGGDEWRVVMVFKRSAYERWWWAGDAHDKSLTPGTCGRT